MLNLWNISKSQAESKFGHYSQSPQPTKRSRTTSPQPPLAATRPLSVKSLKLSFGGYDGVRVGEAAHPGPRHARRLHRSIAQTPKSHLERAHPIDLHKAIEVNEEHSASGQKVHSLGLRQFQKACIFKKIAKEDKKVAYFQCPYCCKGLLNRPDGNRPTTWLIKKSKLHHLKTCKKIPKDFVANNLKRYKGDAMIKQTGNWTLFQSRRRETFVKSAVKRAAKKGQDAFELKCKIPFSAAKAASSKKRVVLWCRKGRRTTLHKGWEKCVGQVEEGSVTPGIHWWEAMRRANGWKKTLQATETDDVTARILKKSERARVKKSALKLLRLRRGCLTCLVAPNSLGKRFLAGPSM